ncbi:O-linked N-acetylglucosamine transferase, SPINDLY family protein [Ekhidna sp.]
MNDEDYIQAIRDASLKLSNGLAEKAMNLCNDLIELQPMRKGAYLLLAQIFLKVNNENSAVDILRQGVKRSGDPLLKINLAILLAKNKRSEEAHKLFSEISRSQEVIDNVKFWFHHAKNSMTLSRFTEAIECYLRCLNKEPNHKAALNNLAAIYQKNNRLNDAEIYYKKLLKYHPMEGLGYCGLASLYQQAQRIDLAIEFYQKALKTSPSLSIAYFNLGQLYAFGKQNHKKALEIYGKGILLGDDQYRKGIRFYEIISRQHVVDWTHYQEDKKDLEDILSWYLESESSPFQIVPYTLSYSNIDPPIFRKIAEKHASTLALDVWRQHPNVKFDHSLSEKKIRIGYLSPNFREHPAGILMRNVFDFHDSKLFEVHAFSLVHTDDFINREIRDSVDYYYDVSELSSLEIASLINRKGIDILVSLAAYNISMKFDVLAFKPAPIQMVFSDYHETTGASFVDYIFTDEYMIDQHLRANFSEKVITLPCSLLINSDLPIDTSIQSSKSDHGLPENAFVFANFNHPKKLDPETFSAWMQILNGFQESILWLYSAGEIEIKERILREASNFGISEDRIVFAKPLKFQKHLERYRHADLFLDNFIYGAHFTGIEALRMGVPMITLRGDNHNRRLSSSLLKFSGLENLIALTKNDYIAMSLKLATKTANLLIIKEKLNNEEDKVIFDTEIQVKYLEKSYQKALIKFKKGSQPNDFSVGSALNLSSFN